MRCEYCGTSNAPLKKCCSNCGEILSGTTINNVTGEAGYRLKDGAFIKSEYTGPGLYFANINGINCQFYANSEDEMMKKARDCVLRAKRLERIDFL